MNTGKAYQQCTLEGKPPSDISFPSMRPKEALNDDAEASEQNNSLALVMCVRLRDNSTSHLMPAAASLLPGTRKYGLLHFFSK